MFSDDTVGSNYVVIAHPISISERSETVKYVTFGANDHPSHLGVCPSFGCAAITLHVSRHNVYTNLVTSSNECNPAPGVPNTKAALPRHLSVSDGPFTARAGKLPKGESMANKRPELILLSHGC